MLSRAGRSAGRMAWRLRLAKARRVAVLGASGGAAGGGGVLMAGATPWAAVGVALAAAAAGGWAGSRKPSGAATWLAGAAGERATARLLRTAQHDGWVVLHDLSIPGSQANVDHVAIHPSGAFVLVIDTKQWSARHTIQTWPGGRLTAGGRDATSKVRTLAWEVSKVQQALGGAAQVGAVMVFHGPKVEDRSGGTFGPVSVLQANQLCAALTDLNGARPARLSAALDVAQILKTRMPSK